MNRLFLYVVLPLSSFAFLGCTSNDSLDSLSMGGVPKWIAEGAKLDSEPAPYRPDPAIIEHESESGQVEFGLIADRREYDTPPAKKAEKAVDPLERGREYRIRRLFR